MNGVPKVWWIRHLFDHANEVQQVTPWGSWTPVRPMGFQGVCLRERLRVAWKVFVGEYDALSWSPPRTVLGECDGR